MIAILTAMPHTLPMTNAQPNINDIETVEAISVENWQGFNEECEKAERRAAAYKRRIAQEKAEVLAILEDLEEKPSIGDSVPAAFVDEKRYGASGWQKALRKAGL
jgi:hypothetical protein